MASRRPRGVGRSSSTPVRRSTSSRTRRLREQPRTVPPTPLRTHLHRQRFEPYPSPRISRWRRRRHRRSSSLRQVVQFSVLETHDSGRGEVSRLGTSGPVGRQRCDATGLPAAGSGARQQRDRRGARSPHRAGAASGPGCVTSRPARAMVAIPARSSEEPGALACARDALAACGMASRRSNGIGAPHWSHVPKVPLSSRSSACSMSVIASSARTAEASAISRSSTLSTSVWPVRSFVVVRQSDAWAVWAASSRSSKARRSVVDRGDRVASMRDATMCAVMVHPPYWRWNRLTLARRAHGVTVGTSVKQASTDLPLTALAELDMLLVLGCSSVTAALPEGTGSADVDLGVLAVAQSPALDAIPPIRDADRPRPRGGRRGAPPVRPPCGETVGAG